MNKKIIHFCKLILWYYDKSIGVYRDKPTTWQSYTEVFEKLVYSKSKQMIKIKEFIKRHAMQPKEMRIMERKTFRTRPELWKALCGRSDSQEIIIELLMDIRDLLSIKNY